jgi:parvulin-like peptidyl-prolyl isomerase
MNKSIKLIIAVIFISLSPFIYSEEVVDAIVAIVNEDIITLSQYKEQYELSDRLLRSRLQGEEYSKAVKQLKAQMLDGMITDLLLLQEANKLGLNVSEQLNMYIENMKKDAGITTDQQLIRAMAQEGIDFEKWKKQQEDVIKKQNVIFNEVGRSIVIDDARIVGYYNMNNEEFTDPPEVSLKAITISLESNTEEAAEAKKKEIDEKIAAGEEFSALSTQFSEGPEKDSQGDLGSFKKGELLQDMQDAVDKINVGDTTPWLKIGNSWILLKLEDRKDSRLRSFEDVREEIREKLYSEREQEGLQTYLVDLKKRSYIKILIENPMDYR